MVAVTLFVQTASRLWWFDKEKITVLLSFGLAIDIVVNIPVIYLGGRLGKNGNDQFARQ
ncbi:MAG: hypothetical protein ACI8WB_003726 [Phenylobacterium sp.]